MLQLRPSCECCNKDLLPDFFIGAHAQSENLTLLTRDAGRYNSYFSKIKLIRPSKR